MERQTDAEATTPRGRPALSVLQNDAHHGLQRAVANPLLELKDLSGFLAEMSQPRTHETHSGQKRGDVAAFVGIAEPTATSLQLRLAELRAAEAPLMQPAGEPGVCLHARQRSGTVDAAPASEPADVKLPLSRLLSAANQPAEASAEAPAEASAEAEAAPALAEAAEAAVAAPRKQRKMMPAISVVLRPPGERSAERTTTVALAVAAPAALAAPALVPRAGRGTSPSHSELDAQRTQRLRAQRVRKPLVPADTRVGRQGGDTRAVFAAIEARLETFGRALPKGLTQGGDAPQPPPPQPPQPPQPQQPQPEQPQMPQPQMPPPSAPALPAELLPPYTELHFEVSSHTRRVHAYGSAHLGSALGL